MRSSFFFALLTRPKLLGALGFLIALGSLILGLMTWGELQSIPTEYPTMSLEDIAAKASEGELWVVVEDGQWDCDNIAYGEMDTDAVLVDDSQTIIAVVGFNGHPSCEQLMSLHPSGKIGLMRDRRYTYLSSELQLSKYRNATTYLDLCGTCSASNSQSGVIMCASCFGFGLVLILISVFIMRYIQKQNRVA